MGLVNVRKALVAGFALALLVAPAGLSRPLGHSALVPLPSVAPPTPLGRAMHWTRQPPEARAGSVASYASGWASIGVVGGVDGRALARSLGLRVLRWLPKLRLVEASGSPAALEALARAADARIRYVEPVTRAEPAHVRNDPLTYQIDPATGVPYEWQFQSIGADRALNLTHGDPTILVGVVDSGIADAPDLRGKIAERFWDTSVDTSAGDTLGHGTFVSSIIAARNDDGFGLAGFCGACRLAVYKAAPLTDFEIAAGIQTLTDAHVRIINLSIVARNVSQAVIDALNYAIAAGVLVVAASGNEGASAVDFPASFLQPPNGTPAAGLAVGASDRSGARASFSNAGAQLSLVAPGTFDTSCDHGILGAVPLVATDFQDSNSCAVTMTNPNDAQYAYASGTSFAVPEVSGVAALVWALQPSLTSVQVANILEQSATRPAGSGWSSTVGWGVLNARAAVESVAGKTSADTIVLAGLRVSTPRGPGAKIVATVKARWGDGTQVLRGATPSCRIDVGAAVLHTSSRLRGGLVTCTFTLPAAGAGKLVIGTMSLASATGPPVAAPFRFSIAARAKQRTARR